MKVLVLQYKGLASMIMGAVQARKGKKKAAEGRNLLSQSEQLRPDEVDTQSRLSLNRIQAKRDSMYSGSYASTLTDGLNESYAALTEGALSLASGGGADVNALLKQSKSAGQAVNNIIGQVENNALAYETEAQRQLESIQQRQLELQLLNHQQKRYDANAMIAAGDAQQMAGQAAAVQGFEDTVNTGLSLMTGGMLNKKAGTGGMDALSGGAGVAAVQSPQVGGGISSKGNARNPFTDSSPDAFIGGFSG